METVKNTQQRILLVLLKNLRIHTATSLSKELKMSRWGVWKVLKKLEKDQLLIFDKTGIGKTSTHLVKLNWKNILVEKILVFSLTREALKYKKWLHNFADLENYVDFLILYGSILYTKEANDIDIINAVREGKFIKVNDVILDVQKTLNKKIHAINFTKREFLDELKRENRAFIDAVKKGAVLFGQENFVRFLKRVKND